MRLGVMYCGDNSMEFLDVLNDTIKYYLVPQKKEK